MGFDAVKKATLAERMTYMKKNKEISGGLRSSTQADAELNHIERAIGQLRAMTQKASGTLNVDYWRERLDAVRAEIRARAGANAAVSRHCSKRSDTLVDNAWRLYTRDPKIDQ